jgi:subtilisin family serine protease
MRINKTIKLSLVSVLLVFGCLPQKELLNTSTPVTTAKKVIPYTGPVELKIDTSIAERLGVKTEKKEVILESEEEKTFSINSVPSGNIVFQETFKIEHKERLFTRNFTINDTSKRYTIHLQRKSPCDAVARVNINGMNWILPSDFKRRTQLEVSKSSLLLNNSNSLQIRLKGNPKDEITLSIVEGGEVGTVKRRLGKLSNTKTNEERLLANDTNIFYPNNEDSLGDLKAFDGEKEIVEGNNSYRIGLTDVNDGTSKFRIGEVSATVREPVEENLQTLLSRYNATLLSRKKYDDNEIVIIKPDLNSTNLDKIMSNVKSLNLYSEEPLTKLTFSSINTAKTVANFIDILVNSGDLISNAGLLIQFDKNGITTQESSDFVNINRSFRNKNYNKDLNLCKGKEFTIKNPRTSDDMWWLKDTKITDAWDYSMGQNTSVAIFDGSFGQYWNSPEFKDRSENRYNCSDNNSSNIASCQEYKECGHGYAIASFIGAELDNNFGIVGVSPRSKIISYPTSDIDNIADNLNKAKTELSLKKIDVINISSGGFLSTLDRIATDKNPNCSIEFGKGNIRHRICNTFVRQMVIDMDNLSNNKKLYDGSQNPYYDPNKRSVVIVSTAGNDGKELRSDGARDDFFFPGQSLNVIGVGAYELSGVDQGNPNTGERIRADFCLSSNIPLISSNYGLPIDIWAPGDNLSIFEQSKQHIGDMDISVCGILQNQWLSWGGTSHAAPIVSGVISLLKSIDKNLDVNDVRRILQETGDTLNHPSFLSSNGQKSLNALKAVQSLTSSKFDTFTGTLLHSDLFIVNPNLSLVLDTNYPSRYKEFVGKKVIVEAWKTPGKDSYGVRRIKLQSDDFIASNPKGIINTNPSGIALEVKPNNIIALPIPSSTRDLSKFSISLGGGQNITLKEIVDDYLIAKVPPKSSSRYSRYYYKRSWWGDYYLSPTL